MNAARKSACATTTWLHKLGIHAALGMAIYTGRLKLKELARGRAPQLLHYYFVDGLVVEFIAHADGDYLFGG